MNAKELQQRLKQFALRLAPLCEALPPGKASQIIEGQLLRSGFSAAANYRAACNAQSKKAFNSKLSIALEEMDETVFWLEMIDELKLVRHDKLALLLQEGTELVRILGASRRTTSRNIKTLLGKDKQE